MSVSAGYKMTEVGVIPDDWDAKPLNSLKPYITSGSRGWAKYYAETGDAFVRITNLLRESIYPDLSDLRCVKLPQSENEGTRTGLCNGDVLVSITADIGIIGYVDDRMPKPAYINQHIATVRVNQTQANSKFLSYFLATEASQRRVRATTDAGAKAEMSLTGVGNLLAAFPPTIAEQSAIAEALSDMDEAIAAQEAVIAKKRALKTATMQALLSGTRRLSSFSGEWEEKALGRCLKVRHGRSQAGVETVDGIYPILATGGEIGRASAYLHPGPSVLIGRKGTIDRPQYSDGPFWSIDTLFYTEIDASADAKFLFYLFQMIDWRTYNEASGVPSLSSSTIESIEVLMPAFDEQSEIAKVITDIDLDLQVNEAKLSKLRQLKAGMTQQLLTGKIRLV